MKILVVDDSLTMRRALSRQLQSAGYMDVVEATNGLEALQQLAGVDLVIMDWNMPVMDGITAVQEIRKMPDKADMKIIMCTSEGARDSVIQAMAIGVNDFIIKPVENHVLLEKIKTLFSGSSETAEPEDTEDGHRIFGLSMEVNQIIDHLSNRLDEEGIENRNASKLVRYALLKLCPTPDDNDIENALLAIKNDLDEWKKA
ncbi:response regulator [bacterium]|nr:response regulator [bacterium]